MNNKKGVFDVLEQLLKRLTLLFVFLSILPKVPDIIEILIEYNIAKPQKISTDRVWYNGKLCYRHELPMSSTSDGNKQDYRKEKETKIYNPRFDWPIRGSITSSYGLRIDPVTGKWSQHNGVDIQASIGTPVQAIADGKVIFSGWLCKGIGYTIVIDHGNGFSTRYGHLSSKIKVKNGESITKGQTIGYSGNSGSRSTGPHLYFEIKKDRIPVDPIRYLTGEPYSKEI